MKKIIIVALIMLILPLSFMLSGCGNTSYDVQFYVENDIYETIKMNNELTLPSTNPNKDYHIFSGWVFENGEEITFDKVKEAKNKPIKVYAKFTFDDVNFAQIDILSQSMSNDGLNVGDKIIVNKCTRNQIRLGDIISYYNYHEANMPSLSLIAKYEVDGQNMLFDNVILGVDNPNGYLNNISPNVQEQQTLVENAKSLNTNIWTHRVIGIYVGEDNNIYLQTKGTNNAFADIGYIRAEYVIGRYIKNQSFNVVYNSNLGSYNHSLDISFNDLSNQEIQKNITKATKILKINGYNDINFENNTNISLSARSYNSTETIRNLLSNQHTFFISEQDSNTLTQNELGVYDIVGSDILDVDVISTTQLNQTYYGIEITFTENGFAKYSELVKQLSTTESSTIHFYIDGNKQTSLEVSEAEENNLKFYFSTTSKETIINFASTILQSSLNAMEISNYVITSVTNEYLEKETSPKNFYCIEANSFANAGYTFKEWNTKQDGTGISFDVNSEIIVNYNLLLYAIWEY